MTWSRGTIIFIFSCVGVLLLLNLTLAGFLFVFEPSSGSIARTVDEGIAISQQKDAVGVSSMGGEFVYQALADGIDRLTFEAVIGVQNSQGIAISDALVTAQIVHNEGVEISQGFTDKNGEAQITYFMPENSVARIEILDIDGEFIEYEKSLNTQGIYQIVHTSATE